MPGPGRNDSIGTICAMAAIFAPPISRHKCAVRQFSTPRGSRASPADNPAMPLLDAALLLSLVLPVGLALFFRHRALHGRDELAARWFAFARRLAMLSSAAPVVWILLLLEKLRQTPFFRNELGDGVF